MHVCLPPHWPVYNATIVALLPTSAGSLVADGQQWRYWESYQPNRISPHTTCNHTSLCGQIPETSPRLAGAMARHRPPFSQQSCMEDKLFSTARHPPNNESTGSLGDHSSKHALSLWATRDTRTLYINPGSRPLVRGVARNKIAKPSPLERTHLVWFSSLRWDSGWI